MKLGYEDVLMDNNGVCWGGFSKKNIRVGWVYIGELHGVHEDLNMAYDRDHWKVKPHINSREVFQVIYKNESKMGIVKGMLSQIK